MAISPTKSRAIQLYEPPQDTVYTIEATSQLVNVPRRTILVYCKHRLLSPALETVDRGYTLIEMAFARRAGSRRFVPFAAAAGYPGRIARFRELNWWLLPTAQPRRIDATLNPEPRLEE